MKVLLICALTLFLLIKFAQGQQPAKRSQVYTWPPCTDRPDSLTHNVDGSPRRFPTPYDFTPERVLVLDRPVVDKRIERSLLVKYNGMRVR